MTTASLDHDASTRTPAAALGALAGITPAAMFLVWNIVSGWGGSTRDFLVDLAGIGAVGVVAGWIVGARSGRSIRSMLVGTFAYPFVAWVVFLPIGVVASTSFSIQDRTLTDPAAVVGAIGGFLVYGVVMLIYLFVYLTPFGVGWSLTYFALRRAMRV